MWSERDGVEVNGQPPELRGQICNALLGEQFWDRGKLIDVVNVIYLSFEDQWHRLTIDCGIIFWSLQDKAPEAWSIPEIGASFPLIDLGSEAGVIGVKLSKYQMKPTAGGSCVVFNFENGVSIVLDNDADSTSYTIT